MGKPSSHNPPSNGSTATPLQVALAWLLQRSPNILLIPGTSSVDHLRDNLKAADLQLPPQAVKDLDAIASAKPKALAQPAKRDRGNGGSVK